jgi:capsular exopolysaccharide synthesis family protein
MAHTRIALPPHFPVVPAQPIDPFDTLEAMPSRTRPPRSVGDILIHRRWLIIGFTAAVVAAAMAWSFTTPPTYKATAVLQIDPEPPRVVAFNDMAPQEEMYNERVFDAYYGTQFERLVSRQVLSRVEQAYDLDHHPAFAAANHRWPRVKAALGQLWPALGALGDEPTGSVFEGLEHHVEVTPVKRSRIVHITAWVPDAKLAAIIPNRIASEYIAATSQERREASEAASRWLESKLVGLRKSNEQATGTIQDFIQQHQLVPNPEGHPSFALQQLEEQNRRYVEAESERVQKEARHRMIAAADPDTAAAALGSDLIRDLKTDLSRLEREVARAQTTLGSQHPRMIELEADLLNARLRLETEIAKGRAAVEREAQAATRRANELGRRLDAQRETTIRKHAQQMQLQFLRKEAESGESIYGELMKRLKELELASQLRVTNVKVIDPAVRPTKPVSPDHTRDFALALAGGLVGGFALAFVRELGDKTLRTARETGLMLRLPSVGTVPAMRGYSRRVLPLVEDLPVRALPGDTLHWSEQVFCEAFRAIRAMVLQRGDPSAPRTLLVTSAQPEEGKSFVAVNLAVALAETGRPVLLVDADFQRPACHYAFDLELPDAGLSTLLHRGGKPETVIIPSGIPNLAFLPTGPRPADPAALLSMERMTALLDAVSERYHWVIVDSPPVLAASDAAVLASLVDRVLLVVRAHTTPIEAGQLARQRLEMLGASFLGVVLNDVKLTRNRNFYSNYS